MKYVVIPSRVIDGINLHKSEKSIVKNDSTVHSAAASFEMAKNAQRISGLPREHPHPERQNEPPLDM